MLPRRAGSHMTAGVRIVFLALSARAAAGYAGEGTGQSVPGVKRVLTSLTDCRVVQSGEADGETVKRCRGVAGYSLRLLNSDDRMSVDVVSPRGKIYPLEYWSVVSHDFSQVGKKAEWWLLRTKNGAATPVGLTVELRVNEFVESRNDGRDITKIVKYLVVAKITADNICVTDKIISGPTAERDARLAVDTAAARACLPGREADRM
jgi:hypothetical protein